MFLNIIKLILKIFRDRYPVCHNRICQKDCIDIEMEPGWLLRSNQYLLLMSATSVIMWGSLQSDGIKTELWTAAHFTQVFHHNPSLIARFMGPTWGPSGADRTQVGPMLAPWILLSGILDRCPFTCTSIPEYQMATNFCPCHDSISVTSCTTFYCNHLIRIWCLNDGLMTAGVNQYVNHINDNVAEACSIKPQIQTWAHFDGLVKERHNSSNLFLALTHGSEGMIFSTLIPLSFSPYQWDH